MVFLSDEYLNEWRDLLRSVSSGPWRSAGPTVVHEDPDITSEIAEARNIPDAQHIARCHPQTIDALIAEALKSRKQRGVLGENLHRAELTVSQRADQIPAGNVADVLA